VTLSLPAFNFFFEIPYIRKFAPRNIPGKFFTPKVLHCTKKVPQYSLSSCLLKVQLVDFFYITRKRIIGRSNVYFELIFQKMRELGGRVTVLDFQQQRDCCAQCPLNVTSSCLPFNQIHIESQMCEVALELGNMWQEGAGWQGRHSQCALWCLPNHTRQR
jgi:hypothetical protein